MYKIKCGLVLIAGLSAAAGGFGGVIISDLGAAALGAPGTSAVDYSSPAQVGTQFTMGATSFNNVSFTLGLFANGNRSLGPLDVTVQLYGGTTASPSGSALLTILPAGPYTGQSGDYTFTAPSNFTLQANTIYWLVAGSVQDQEGWVTFNNTLSGRQPTGAFASAPLGYNRAASGLPTSLFSSTDTVAYEVDGTAVVGGAIPEPSTLAMIMIGLGITGPSRAGSTGNKKSGGVLDVLPRPLRTRLRSHFSVGARQL